MGVQSFLQQPGLPANGSHNGMDPACRKETLMIAAFVLVAAYLSLAEVGSRVLPPPPKPALVQVQAAPADQRAAAD